jgi:competence protein ComEC
LAAEVLSFPHHGSWPDGQASIVLDSVAPEIVVISVGTTGDRYGHPNQPVFDALAERPAIRVMCTQATNKCCADAVGRRPSTTALLATEARSVGLAFPDSPSGCPCAGNIVIDLDAKPIVISPSHRMHVKMLSTLFDRPQCLRSIGPELAT